MKRFFGYAFGFFLITILFISISQAGPDGIESASKEQIALVKVLLNSDVVVKKSAAIKSSIHKRAYYVGFNFTVSGIKETQTGIWLVSGEKHHPKAVLAVDGFAKNFSRATAADKTDPPTAYSTDKESEGLKKYLRIFK